MARNIIREAVRLLMFLPRKKYYKKKKKNLINTTPTILSNNCFGGMVYHNLGLQFTSPTINLFISDDDFMKFLGNLKGYIDAELEEILESPEAYPVGSLTCCNDTIHIHFMHYDTFEQAKEKWDMRKKRMDLNNLYVFFQPASMTQDEIEAFESLPYINKMLIIKENPTNSKYVRTPEVLLKENYKTGEILAYKSRFSLQRWMDDIDYVEFLNS